MWAPLDIVAIGVPPLGALTLLVLGLASARSGRLPPLLAGLSVFVVAAVAVVSPRLPQRQPMPTRAVRIAAANVRGGTTSPRSTAAALAGRDADVLVMVEGRTVISLEVQAVTDLPERVVAAELRVWSRWPLTRLPATPPITDGKLLRVRIDHPDGAFVLHVVHAPNPLYEATFRQQEDLAAHLVDNILAEQLPVVLIGDLNMSDRTEGYRIIAREMRDAMRAGSWPEDTYQLHVWRVLMLRIDHLFVPKGWCAAEPMAFEVPGSDHRGIEATIGPCPAGGSG
jgi:endonuclease/exonuclease/phosphatase (EEP) superfamily protein YafD